MAAPGEVDKALLTISEQIAELQRQIHVSMSALGSSASVRAAAGKGEDRTCSFLIVAGLPVLCVVVRLALCNVDNVG